MTKAEMIYTKIGIEPKQFTDTMQERCYPLTVVCDLMDEWAAQQLSAERERHLKSQETIMKMLDDSFNSKMKERQRAGKLVHALKMCLQALRVLDAKDYVAYTAGKVALIEYQKTLNEYDTATKEPGSH